MRCCPVAGWADGQSTTLHWLVKRELSCSHSTKLWRSVGATDISPLRNGILTMEAVTYAEIITQASMPGEDVGGDPSVLRYVRGRGL
ncbi:hypothetical protein BHE74_00040289 [Ensete ventricosum]|nr:hypothetical protein BHE74_00040289 [Ensete ventricosum]